MPFGWKKLSDKAQVGKSSSYQADAVGLEDEVEEAHEASCRRGRLLLDAQHAEAAALAALDGGFVSAGLLLPRKRRALVPHRGSNFWAAWYQPAVCAVFIKYERRRCKLRLST
jgi:hypothetical protein